MSRSLAPLRHRPFRRLVAGQLASGIGDASYAVALPWYVLATHGGTLLLGTALAAYGLPRTLAIVAGGHASDRWRPWTVMMASDLVRMAAVAGMAAAAALGPARAAVLIPIAVALGTGEGFFLPSSFAIVPALLPDADLQPGNALASGVTYLASLAGPAAGGLLVAAAGPAPAFALDAATFAISAATLFGVRAASRHGTAQPQTAQQEAAQQEAGQQAPRLLPVLRSSRILLIILLVTVTANLGSGGIDQVALPALAHGPLHAGARGYGLLNAAFAIGALAGTLLAGLLGGARRPAVLGSVAFLSSAALMAVTPLAGATAVVAVLLAAWGVLNGIGNVVMITVFQRWAPPALLGRLTGLLVLASIGIFPVSAVLGALIVHGLGPGPFFPMAAVALAAAIAAGLSRREWRDLGTPAQPGPGLADRVGTERSRPEPGRPQATGS